MKDSFSLVNQSGDNLLDYILRERQHGKNVRYHAMGKPIASDPRTMNHTCPSCGGGTGMWLSDEEQERLRREGLEFDNWAWLNEGEKRIKDVPRGLGYVFAANLNAGLSGPPAGQLGPPPGMSGPPPPPPKSKKLQRAINLARQMLKTKECNDAISSFFQDGRSVAWTLDNNSGTVDEQPDNDGGGYVAWTQANLTISFYKGFYVGAEGDVLDDSGKNIINKSKLVEDPDYRRAWTVLHELAHVTAKYIRHDLPTSTSNESVNRAIYDACLKQKVKVPGAVGGRVQ